MVGWLNRCRIHGYKGPTVYYTSWWQSVRKFRRCTIDQSNNDCAGERSIRILRISLREELLVWYSVTELGTLVAIKHGKVIMENLRLRVDTPSKNVWSFNLYPDLSHFSYLEPIALKKRTFFKDPEVVLQVNAVIISQIPCRSLTQMNIY